MGLPTFIRLENSLEKALTYYNSPQMKHFSFAGVHLLPNYRYPYKQQTYAIDGIELEAIGAVWVCDMCGNRLADISDNFTVPYNFNDPETGLPQIIWALNEVGFDAGYRLIYLQIENGANAFIYSSPFMLTSEKGEFSTNWHYRNKGTDPMLSIGLCTYFRQKMSSQELSNFSSIGPVTSIITSTSSITRLEKHNFDIVDIEVMEMFKELFRLSQVYSVPVNFLRPISLVPSALTDKRGLPARTSLYEAFDTPELEADENFTEQSLRLAKNYNDIFDPLAPVIVPPEPVPPIPVINLTAINISEIGENEALNTLPVTYTFNYANFPVAPDYFFFQYSLDGETWTNNANSVTSPVTIPVTSPLTNNYYYRIYHPPTDTYSNILQAPQARIIITNVIVGPNNLSTGARFNIYFTVENFTTNGVTPYAFEASIDGVTWLSPNMVASGLYENPGRIIMAYSGTPYTYFRMRYNPLSLISNTYQL